MTDAAARESAYRPAAPRAGPPDRSAFLPGRHLGLPAVGLLAASLLLGLGLALWSAHRNELANRAAVVLAAPMHIESQRGKRGLSGPPDRYVFAAGDTMPLELVPSSSHGDRFRLSLVDPSSGRELHPSFRDAQGRLSRLPQVVALDKKTSSVWLNLRRGWVPAGNYSFVLTSLDPRDSQQKPDVFRVQL